MSFNVVGAVEVPLTVFGSLVTEMSPIDLPEGVSPDNQDVVYVPGGVASRPCLQKVFATPFTGTQAVTYGKSFVTKSGNIFNLFMDATGKLFVEDFTNTPGAWTLIYTAAAGTQYAKSVTAFGREYIAFSDGLKGTDLAIQWDGTNIDPVTQDGPGAPPAVASISLPAVSMLATGGPTVINLTECDPASPNPNGSFSHINCFTNTNIAGIVAVGSVVTIAGNASGAMNQSNLSVIAVYAQPTGLNLFVVSAYLPAGTVFGLGGTATVSTGVTMTRANNVVTVTTNGAHQLQPGYQAQITGVPQQAVGTSISSVKIDNENLPGLATFTMASAHGLVPGIFVSISGVVAVNVGTGISNIVRNGNIVTVTMSAAHGLSPGAVVTLSGVGVSSFNTTVPVLQVVSTTVFTFAQVDADATSSGGTVALNWPIPQSTTPTYFQVQAVPSATTFQVAISYSDGTWGAGGTVSYAWDGTFAVLTVPNSTTFTYKQYGPNATATTVGMVTPFGQAAPGLHQCQVLFLTRNGYITRPSPPVQFFANGGQYISVSQIPLGPNNVVARILAFTGAGGAYFFYIPAIPQVNGQPVGTSTQINDNTTTGILLDFSDNTLFAGLGISTPGNTVANQIVLDSAIGFGYYSSRLLTWGQRSRIQNFLNMGFNGGALPSFPTLPAGWTPGGSGAGGALALGVGPGGGASWQQTGVGSLFQGAYQDAYGAPILTPNTLYRVRAWIKNVGPTFSFTISSVSSGFSTTATMIGNSSTGSFVEGVFSAATPASIPSDMILTMSTTGGGSYISAISICYADKTAGSSNPTFFLDQILYASYVNNPEAFDGLSGKFGAVNDIRKMMDVGIIRNTLYLFTRDPSGRIHATNDNGSTEPAGWTVSEVAANCGLLSIFCLTKSQADDASGGGGEESLAWASASGARIFDGSQPWKISQEIQPDWDSLNPAFAPNVWAVNDPNARVIYFGVQFVGVGKIYPVNYRELDTPYQIAMAAPYHPSFSGHLIATDNTRKWTRWNMQMAGAALMYRVGPTKLSLVLFSNNPTGNVYTLNPAKLTDDDLGQMNPYYTTYFFPDRIQEAMLRDAQGQPLGAHRKLLQYLTAFISGTGLINITAYPQSLSNPWPLTCQRTLAAAPTYDLEWTGGSAMGQRIAIKFASAPNGGTDNGFNLQKVMCALKAVRHLPVRGAA